MKAVLNFAATIGMATTVFGMCLAFSQPREHLERLFYPAISETVQVDLAGLLQGLQESGSVCLDVRLPIQYSEARVPHSINLPFSTSDGYVESFCLMLKPSDSLFLYGTGESGDIYQIERKLRKSGWKGAILLFEDGWQLWVRCGLPVVREQKVTRD